MAERKIAFANSLRGIAALTVMFGHYVLVFNAMGGAYHGFPKLSRMPFPKAYWIFANEPMIWINVGPFGVGLFFLVSGLVIPQSVNSLAGQRGGVVAFIIGRLFRIWPTYLAGLSVTIFATWFATQFNGYPFVLTPEQIASQATLFRDWIGTIPFDGVVWTLEVETKFYLFALLFWSGIAKAKFYPIFFMFGLACVMSTTGAVYDDTFIGVTVKNFLWAMPYIAFMSIGILFNYHYRSRISTAELVVSAIAAFAIFSRTADEQGFLGLNIISYGLALALFALLYFFASNWSGGPVIRFFAKISFPLYASHAVAGYIGMNIMIHYFGFGPDLALIFQIFIAVTVATIINFTIEEPTHRLGKRFGRMWTEWKGMSHHAVMAPVKSTSA